MGRGIYGCSILSKPPKILTNLLFPMYTVPNAVFSLSLPLETSAANWKISNSLFILIRLTVYLWERQSQSFSNHRTMNINKWPEHKFQCIRFSTKYTWQTFGHAPCSWLPIRPPELHGMVNGRKFGSWTKSLYTTKKYRAGFAPYNTFVRVRI